jgi:hypothetical protein
MRDRATGNDGDAAGTTAPAAWIATSARLLLFLANIPKSSFEICLSMIPRRNRNQYLRNFPTDAIIRPNPIEEDIRIG